MRRSLARWAFLAIAAGIIVVLTLTPSSGASAATSFLCMTCGAWLQDDFNNILLFAPFGLGLAIVGMQPVRAAATSLAFSLAVEALQSWVIPGRDAAAADLLTNCLGGWLGALCWQWKPWWPSRDVARRIALPAALIVGLGLGVAGRWFGLRIPDGPYYPSLDPARGPYPSPARLIQATWNGRELQCCPDEDWKRLQRELAKAPVDFRVRAELLAAPTKMGRLVTVWDNRSRPVVVVGVDGRGVWGNFATAGQGRGGRQFAVHAPATAAWAPGDTIDIVMRGERGKWSIRLDHSGVQSDGVLHQSPVLAAFYFLPDFAMTREPVPFWRWLVTLFPVIVVAVWSARAHRRWEPWACAAVLVGTGGVVGMPWMFPRLLIPGVGGVLLTFGVVVMIVGRIERSSRGRLAT